MRTLSINTAVVIKQVATIKPEQMRHVLYGMNEDIRAEVAKFVGCDTIEHNALAEAIYKNRERIKEEYNAITNDEFDAYIKERNKIVTIDDLPEVA